ncbi:MAG: hypothetical protein H6905_10565 [Hyphomicrobiales bacterium]|nr:hypothetical protein [Hyphomicrobiales bacterium]
MEWQRGLKLGAWAILLSLGLTACDSHQQSRPLNYEKGVYLGRPDTPLSEDTLQRLRDRAAYQGRSVTVSGEGRDAQALSARSYPQQPDALRQRVLEQGSE